MMLPCTGVVLNDLQRVLPAPLFYVSISERCPLLVNCYSLLYLGYGPEAQTEHGSMQATAEVSWIDVNS